MPGDNEQQLILSFMGQVQDALKGIDGLKAGLTGMESTLAQVGSKAAGVSKDIGAKFKEAGDVIQSASRRIENSIGGFVRRAVGLLGAGGLVGSIYKSVGAYQNFEQVVMRLSLRMGDQGVKSIKAYTDQLRRLSKQGGTSVAELARGLEQVIASDVKGAKGAQGSMKLLEASNKAAIASMTDTGQMVDVVSAVMESYGMSVDDASKVTDTLFSTMRNGDISVESLMGGIKGITLLAAPMGIKFEEVGAAMAALTKGNLDAGSAFGALELVFRAMIKPTAQMNALLKANGFTTMEAMVKAKGLVGVLEAMQKVSGGSAFALGKFVQRAEGVKGISILAGKGLSDFKAALDATGKSAGVTEQMYASMSETFAQRTARFKQTMEDTFLKIGEKLMPTVNDLMDKLSAWVNENGDKIAEFFKTAVDKIIEFGQYVIENGQTIALTLGTIWATGKLIEWVGLIGGAVTAVKAIGGALLAIPSALAKVGGALQALLAGPLLPVAAALAGIGTTGFALFKNQQAYKEGAEIGKRSGDVYKDIRASTVETLQPYSKEDLGYVTRESDDYAALVKSAFRQFSEARGGAQPTFLQAEQIRRAVESGIKQALESAPTKEALAGYATNMSDAMIGELTSGRVTDAAAEALKAGTVKGAVEGLEDAKVAAARKRAAEKAAREWAQAAAFLKGLRGSVLKEDEDEIARTWTRYELLVDKILETRFKTEEERQEALALANQKREQELDEIYKKRFDEGQKRDAEIAAKRKKYEAEIEDQTKKALDNYFKERDDWEAQMRAKYPADYAQFEVAEAKAQAQGGSLAGSMQTFGAGLQEVMGQVKDWLTSALKSMADAVADVGMDFANVFLDLFKTPMNMLKQLLSQAIELAAEGKQYLVLTNREKSEIEANIGRPMTEAEMREAAQVISPKELTALQREGRIGEYTVVGERTPEQAADSVLEKFISFWENLAQNLDGILKWVEGTAFPRLINAIIKALPKIVNAVIGFVRATAKALAKDWLQKIIDTVLPLIIKMAEGALQSVKDFLRNLNVEKFINSIINFIIDLIISIVKDVIDLVAKVIPKLIGNINRAIPGIVKNLVTAIVMELIPEIVMALVDAIKEIFTGDNVTGSKTWDGVLSLLTGGISGTVGKMLHDGGMISRDMLRSTRSLEGAVRAHSGMFIGSTQGLGLRQDEVPIIAQVGEAVLNRAAVANMGGPSSINRINAGESMGAGGDVTVVNQLSVGHLLSRDTPRVIDEMQGDSLRRRNGRTYKELTRGKVLGYVPRTK